MVTRILVEKKEGFNVEAVALKEAINHLLHIESLEGLRIINCYDLEAVDANDLEMIKTSILSEPNVDVVNEGAFSPQNGDIAFRIALLPGQFDQRADSVAQCMEIITLKARTGCLTSKIIVLSGVLSVGEVESIKKYLINPVESYEVSMVIPESAHLLTDAPEDVQVIEGFIDLNATALETLRKQMGFAMTHLDLVFVQDYFKNEEKRNPTETEVKVIDTYWSDHCRHTTFLTELTTIEIEEGAYMAPIKRAFETYKTLRNTVYPAGGRPFTLMDLATINMKALRKSGGLEDLDVSDEINACSIKIEVDVAGKNEPWLLMFKNETHNHPTEIEPYGGAATCLGGAIRDPLSGRSYVYQSMRVTGAADPNKPFEDTLEGKLPQRVITQKAAAGFSAYGNQIGLTTGIVSEVYDDGFVAKRMEVGAVVGAAPYENVKRSEPMLGDLVVLIGGRTGRDGVGGATGSSKAHDEESLEKCGAEVQKGNPPEERKIQRLFRQPDVSTRIKRCNDFGAGGVSVAIGELADSLEINLDAVPKKYEGLNGTELAISESQERMAVVIAPADLEYILKACQSENLEASVVATVMDHGRLKMHWKGQDILNVSRKFLDTNGVKSYAQAKIVAPVGKSFFEGTKTLEQSTFESLWIEQLSDLNACSQKGLIERFDNTIGSGTVLMPLGGQSAETPIQTMVAKIPVQNGKTDTVSMMSYGYNPKVGKWSPFHGGLYAVVESIAKIVATGGDYKKIRLSLQEYFERLGEDQTKWGKPLAALLGASLAQDAFGTAAIGGKDSMSGSFKALDVPPTLISFAVAHGHVDGIISPELKSAGSKLYYYKALRDADEMVDFDALKTAYDRIHKGIGAGVIKSAYAVGVAGLGGALAKMSFGNGIGFKLNDAVKVDLFEAAYGSIVFETVKAFDEPFVQIGETSSEWCFQVCDMRVDAERVMAAWKKPLEDVFPTVAHHADQKEATQYAFDKRTTHTPAIKQVKPKVFIPIFPGTNCEYDTERAFREAGAEVESIVFRNLTPSDVQLSIEAYAKAIKSAQMIALPGGFSAGDEPEGSGKFIASVFKNPEIAEAVMALLNQKDGLMLGICNGFQALVKLGLLPYGEIRDLTASAPTLTFNTIGRHVARMARVKVSSVNSPWLCNHNVGEVFQTAFSHGEGRFYAEETLVKALAERGQIATQYVDLKDRATYDGVYNINGSVDAIEGIFSPDGRIFGKMGHVERTGDGLYKNVYGKTDFDIFSAGVKYFK